MHAKNSSSMKLIPQKLIQWPYLLMQKIIQQQKRNASVKFKK